MRWDFVGCATVICGRISELLSCVLTTDFCPWANKWVYWMKHPAAALGLAAVVALACGVFVNPIAFMPGAAIFVTLFLGYGWPWIVMRGVTGRVVFERSRADEGEPVEVKLIITNSWPLPVWGLSLVGGFSNEADDHMAVALARVGAFATHEFAFRFVPDCRGQYPLETPRLQTGFPFGLKIDSRPVVVESKLLVRPKTFVIDELLDAAETRASDDFLSEHRVGECGDMLGTRAFRCGDSLRRVHWAQTARYDRLIVCERQASANSALLVQLDLDPAVHRGEGRDNSWEWLIRIAASLCRAYHEQHAHVVCRIGREDVRVLPGAAGFQRFLDVLARLPRLPERSCDVATLAREWADGSRTHRLATVATSGPAWSGLRVVVTTDLGLSRHPRGRANRGMQRELVLHAAAFDSATNGSANCELCDQERIAAHPGTVVIDDVRQLAQQFRQRWKRACYAA